MIRRKYRLKKLTVPNMTYAKGKGTKKQQHAPTPTLSQRAKKQGRYKEKSRRGGNSRRERRGCLAEQKQGGQYDEPD
jgi:hypothetical protein